LQHSKLEARLRRGRLTESTLETGQYGLCNALKIDAYSLS
jgi:hypothetical protein